MTQIKEIHLRTNLTGLRDFTLSGIASGRNEY
jgi:hypothetical protein